MDFSHISYFRKEVLSLFLPSFRPSNTEHWVRIEFHVAQCSVLVKVLCQWTKFSKLEWGNSFSSASIIHTPGLAIVIASKNKSFMGWFHSTFSWPAQSSWGFSIDSKSVTGLPSINAAVAGLCAFNARFAVIASGLHFGPAFPMKS